MVTRTKEERVDLSYRQIQFDNKSGSQISDTTNPFSVTLQSQVTYPVANLPSWRQRIKQHLPATTPSSGDHWKVSADYSEIGIRRMTNLTFPPSFQTDRTWYTQGHPLNAGKMAFAGQESEAFNQARLAFIKKARAAQTYLQGGVFVLELGKTIRGILRPAKQIDRLLKRYLRGLKKTRNRFDRRPPSGWKDFGKRQSKLMAVASEKWIETQFGLLPLISDLDGAVKSLAEFAYRSDQKVVRGLGKQESFHSKTASFVDLGFGGRLDFDVVLRSECSVRYIGGVRVSSNEDSTFFPQSLGFTISNWLPSIWELIPYSFLVDYFTNLGDMIDAYSFPLTAVSWLNETIYRTGIAECANVRLTKPADTANERYLWSSKTPGSYRVDGVQFVRSSPNPSTLLPGFRFKVPGLGSTKWLNMAALGVLHASAKTVYFR